MTLLTVRQVAERLNCSESLVYQLVDSGRIAVVRIGNGRGTIRLRPEDVDEYIEGCMQAKQELVPPAIKSPKKVTTKADWF